MTQRHSIAIDRSVAAPDDSSNSFFELGIKYSSGRSGPLDLVAAHKWFNLAAMRGNAEAAQHRHEIAIQMSASEIAAAQRAARNWHTTH